MSKKPGKRRPSAQRASAQRPPAPRPAPAGQPVNPTTQRTPEQARGNANLILGAGLAAVFLLFWYYHLLTLNQMTDLSAGLAMPDQLAGGYDAAHVEALRAAMDDDARGQLNYLHKTAGLLFPLFLALVTMLAVAVHVERGWKRWSLWAVPMAFAVVDLWENNAIDALFQATPPDASAVALASTLTVLRWVLLAATGAVAAGVLVAAFIHTLRSKMREAGPR
ncbi:hypothetical protein ACQ3I4_10850 [Zafaria sp. Z1313]|uniref:hypothetical protein n=1 Tax=unclassified Zafaria TaxID=2828765 RepID=UPI002E7A6A72|nr:hypothetical protein [Zafaria sp. J156]MEE1622246.1 hypothetical protein [Zafaria sp. J156]